MAAPKRVVTGLFLTLFLAGLLRGAPAPRRQDTEPDLLARIGREQNLVNRAKLEVRLGRVKLFQATEAYDRGDVEECYQLLAAYLERMKGAWATLQSSGKRGGTTRVSGNWTSLCGRMGAIWTISSVAFPFKTGLQWKRSRRKWTNCAIRCSKRCFPLSTYGRNLASQPRIHRGSSL